MHDMYYLLLALLIMPVTVTHALSMTTPNDPAYENQPQHWNSSHAVTLNAVGSEIIGAFSNANGMSFGTEAGGGITGSYTVPATTAFLTTAMASNRGSDFVQAAAVFAGTSASGTIASNGISVSIGPYLTTAAQSNHSHGNPTLALTNLSGTTASASNGLTLSLSAGNYLTTAMASNRGSDFVQATAAFAGTSASGTINSTGISVSIGPYLTTAMASNRATDFVQATAAFAGTNASGTINSTGISVSVAAPAAAAASFFDNIFYLQGSTTMSVQGSTSHIAPFMLPYDISISYLRLMVSANFPGTATIATTNAATGSCSIASTIFAVVYVQNTGASSQSLKSTASGSVGFTQRWSLSANATAGSQWTLSKTMSFQNTTGATSFTTQSVASTSNVNLASDDLTVMTGMKALEIPFATSLAAGNYWMMLGISSSSATGGSGTLTRLNMSVSNIGVSQSGFALGHWGNNTNASVNIMPGLGSFTTNAIGTTASLGYSNISSSAANNIPWWQFHRTT